MAGQSDRFFIFDLYPLCGGNPEGVSGKLEPVLFSQVMVSTRIQANESVTDVPARTTYCR